MKNFTIDLENTKRLSSYLEKRYKLHGYSKRPVFVSESGVTNDEDIVFLKECKVDALLIGRAFMESEKPYEVAKGGKESLMEIKICGITKEYEIDKLIEQKVEYAGFVINYPKSKRNNSLEEAEGLLKYIKEKQGNIKTVAVTVSPTLKQIKQIEQLGFDILQVHKDLLPQVLEETRLPIFRAINIGEDADINVEDSEK